MATMKDDQSVNDPNQISPTFFNQVAQIAHFFTMYALVFTASVFAGWWGEAIAFAACVLYAGIHEFVWDPLEENAATRGSDLEDFLFLCAGGGLGVFVGILFRLLRHG